MLKCFRVVIPALASILLRGQQLPYPTYVNPSTLFVGGDAATIRVVNGSYGAGLTALWNGSPRATSPDSDTSGAYIVTVQPQDLATSQLAQITLVNAQGAVIDTIDFPVVYNILPSGVAFDTTRNRLYLATPAQ